MRKVFLLSVATMLLVCCATKRSNEYQERIVTQYVTKEIHDTLREKSSDSVHVEVKTLNDTVYVTKYKERVRWRDKIVVKTDTITRDSVVVRELEVVKEKRIVPKWCYGSMVILCLVVIFLISFKYIFKR